MSDRRWMKVLPDSTGRRIMLDNHYELLYDNKTGNWQIGDTVTGLGSNSSGVITGIRVITATTGILILELSDATQALDDPTFNDNEALQVGGQTVALANGVGYPVYKQSNIIVGANNSQNRLNIDEQGAANIRFAEGTMAFSGLGAARFSQSTVLKSYEFSTDNRESGAGLTGFSSVTGSGGTETFISASRCVRLETDTTSGAFYRKTSDVHHKLTTNASNFAVMGVLCGDSGKSGLVREWGMNNITNGLYFKQSGSNMYVAWKSDTTGPVVENVVSQSNWNVDNVSGTRGARNPSGFQLDPTKVNTYWMDYKVFGGGAVRFGVFNGSERITVHEQVFDNVEIDTWIGDRSLPMQVEQKNEDTTVSSSELRFYGGSVSVEGEFDTRYWSSTQSVFVNKEVTGDPTYICALRPSLTHKGFRNDKMLLLKTLNLMAWSGSNDSRVRFIIYGQPVLSGSTYSGSILPLGQSAMEVDTAGDFDPTWFPGESFFRSAVTSLKGQKEIDLSDFMSYQGPSLVLRADGTQTVVAFAVQTVDNTTASVDFTLSWSEVDS